MIISKQTRTFTYDVTLQPYSPWVWFGKVTFDNYEQPSLYDPDYFDFSVTYNESTLEIGQVRVVEEQESKVASKSACESTVSSFYFDIEEQILYVHPNHTLRLDGSTEVVPFIVSGHSTTMVFYDENKIEYLPYLSTALTLTKSADRLVYSKMSFVSNSVDFDNRNGVFDVAGDDPVPGSDVYFYYISNKEARAGVTTLTPIYIGYLDSDSMDYDTYTLGISDKRERLNIDIPLNTFTTDDYPDLEESLEDAVVPRLYSYATGVPGICTNGEAESGDVTYCLAETITSIDTVYIYDDDDEWTSVEFTEDLDNGGFYLDDSVGRNSSDSAYSTKADCTGIDIEQPELIVRDLIEDYLGYTYSDTFFNTDAFDNAGGYLKPIYFYMDESKAFFEYIELLQDSSTYGFRFDFDMENRFTILIDDLEKELSATYTYIDNVSDVTTAERDFTEYASSVVVEYAADIESEEYLEVTNTDFQISVLKTYNNYTNEVTKTSYLKSEEDAEEKALRVATDYQKPRLQITFKLQDIVYHDLYEVVTVDTGTKTRTYLGVRNLKISEIKYLLATGQTQITGYDVTT